MFNLIKSNRMENLMQGLLHVLETPLSDPMQPEWVGVQSRGMKQWVSTEMARRIGVCANVNFMSPRQIINWALGRERDFQGELNTEILTWALADALHLDWLPPGQSAAFEPVSHYLTRDPGGQKQVMLARKLARVMDDYQIFRPQMLLGWEAGDEPAHPGDPVEAWQAPLWQHLASELPQSRLHERMAAFLTRAAQGEFPTDIPERICLFGISTLPPAFIEVLSKLAEATQVYQFLLTPSDQFFSYIRSPQEAARLEQHAPEVEETHVETGNPLLASLGRSVREFQDGLEETAYQDVDIFEDPLDQGEETLLRILQSDIMNLIHRRPGGDELPVPVFSQDDSLTLHICHSPMREAQVVKDLILNAFETIPDLSPHEVIVMMPDIESYTPFIEAVFSSEFPLPYAVSDRRKKLESQTLEAFVKILDLVGSRLELTPVLDLLLAPAIGGRFRITPMETESLETIARETGILWGRDPEHREDLTQVSFSENTWEFGFQRLLTGLAVPEDREELMAGVLPADRFEGIEAELLGRFAHFAHTLFDMLSLMDGERTPAQWADDLGTLVRSLMGGEDAPESDMVFLLQTVAEMARDAQAAGFERTISFEAMKQILESKLDQRIAQGAFLSGGITFCNLMPMRSIPFKLVCLMGMDEASFPRRVVESGFDLMTKYARRGDKKGRDEDRYLFLESLLSARERMIITYTGLSIRDNSEIPCSGVVSELMDAVAQSFEFEEDQGWIFEHGLHPFLPRYFSGGPDRLSPDHLFSYSRRQFALAQSRLVTANGDEGTDPMAALTHAGEGDAETTVVSPRDFVRFFRMPGRAFVADRLKISLTELEEPPQDREPFQLDGLERYALGQNLLDRELAGQDGPEREALASAARISALGFDRVRAMGCLPLGEQGRMSWESVVSQVVPVRDQALDQRSEELIPVTLPIDLAFESVSMVGQARDLFQVGETEVFHCFSAGVGRLGAGRLLTAWIRHLILSKALDAQGKGGRLYSFVTGKEPKTPEQPLTLVFSPVEAKDDTLAALVALYREGQDRFVPFFPRSCFALVENLKKQDYIQDDGVLAKAMAAAAREWDDARTGMGEGQDRILELYLSTPQGRINPFGSLERLRAWEIPDLALTVYKPLLDNLDIAS